MKIKVRRVAQKFKMDSISFLKGHVFSTVPGRTLIGDDPNNSGLSKVLELKDDRNLGRVRVKTAPNQWNVCEGVQGKPLQCIETAECDINGSNQDCSYPQHPVGVDGKKGRRLSIQETSCLDSSTYQNNTNVNNYYSKSTRKAYTEAARPNHHSSDTSTYLSPQRTRPMSYKRLYQTQGPVLFTNTPILGSESKGCALHPWRESHNDERVISQNASKRKVHRSLFYHEVDRIHAYPSAIKFVEDSNVRDGRSIKREIECHLYIYQKLSQMCKDENRVNAKIEDLWPSAEMFAYHLDKRNPGNSVIVTRKLSGPDFFDIIRTEHHDGVKGCVHQHEFNKLQWCTLALRRVYQYGQFGIRHNDIKPDNIVLDLYESNEGGVHGVSSKRLDVKIIDLGTASMQNARDFTGGTSWYESPEQKLLEYYTKKKKDLEAAKRVDIGLSSDLWGAGVSIAEVLIGKRVADSMKKPNGCGPLEFGAGEDTAEWTVNVLSWRNMAQEALGLYSGCDHWLPICKKAAKYVFESLVRPVPSERINIKTVIQQMDIYTKEAKFL